jgi:hypothetical protein
MSVAPKQDWAAYETRAAEDEAVWVRTLDTGDRFVIYADLFGLIWRARQDRGRGDWQAVDRWSWEQKLALRLRCTQAFQRLDEIRHGRAAAEDPC